MINDHLTNLTDDAFHAEFFFNPGVTDETHVAWHWGSVAGS